MLILLKHSVLQRFLTSITTRHCTTMVALTPPPMPLWQRFMSALWQARFFTTVNRLGDLPKYKVPEIAFAGRSNAGKSTAINLLCNQKHLAFASKTPGRTQHINFFSIGGARVGQHRKDPTRTEEIRAFLVDLRGKRRTLPLWFYQRQLVQQRGRCDHPPNSGSFVIGSHRMGMSTSRGNHW